MPLEPTELKWGEPTDGPSSGWDVAHAENMAARIFRIGMMPDIQHWIWKARIAGNASSGEYSYAALKVWIGHRWSPIWILAFNQEDRKFNTYDINPTERLPWDKRVVPVPLMTNVSVMFAWKDERSTNTVADFKVENVIVQEGKLL